MAKVREYEQRVHVGTLPGTPRASAPNAYGQAFQELGQIGSNLAQSEARRQQQVEREQRDREDRRATLDAALAVDEARRSLTTYMRDLQNTTEGDPDGFAGKVDAAVEEYGKKALAGMTNERARGYAEQHFSSMRTSLFGQAMTWEAQRAVQYDGDRVSGLVSGLARDLAGDPSQYAAYRTLAHEAIGLARADPHQRERMREAADRAFRQAAAEGDVLRNPAGVLAATDGILGLSSEAPADLTAGEQSDWRSLASAEDRAAFAQAVRNRRASPGETGAVVSGTVAPDRGQPQPAGGTLAYLNELAPDELVRVRQAALTQVNRQQHGERATIERHERDAAALAGVGTVDPQPVARDRYVAAFGPEDGARRFDEAQKVQVYARDRASLRGMPASDMRALIEARGPAGVDGAAGDLTRQHALARAVADEMKAREDDGAAYVIATAPAVGAAAARVFGPGPSGVPTWTDMAVPAPDRRAAMDAYLTAAVAEQRRLGIARVRPLPAEAEAYVANAAMKVAGSGDRMAATIGGLAQTFGAYWPDIYRQVVGGKSGNTIPDSFVVIPGIPESRTAVREEVARLDSIKLDDLKKQVEAGKPKEVEEKVQAGLAAFYEAMMPGAQNTRTATAIRNVAEKVALARLAGGAKVGDAVEAGIDTVIGHLSLGSQHSARTYAVPKSEQPERVRAGLGVAVQRIDRWNLPAPVDLTGIRKPEEAQAEWQAMVRDRPMWVTNDDESGLLLFTTGADGRPRPVTWDGGKQIEFSWSDLRAFGEDQATQQAIGAASALTAPGAIPTSRSTLERERAEKRRALLEQEARNRVGR